MLWSLHLHGFTYGCCWVRSQKGKSRVFWYLEFVVGFKLWSHLDLQHEYKLGAECFLIVGHVIALQSEKGFAFSITCFFPFTSSCCHYLWAPLNSSEELIKCWKEIFNIFHSCLKSWKVLEHFWMLLPMWINIRFPKHFKELISL